jgi:hypothetical protein
MSNPRRGQRAAAQPSSHRPPPEAVAVAADPDPPASSKLLGAGTRRQQPATSVPGGWWLVCNCVVRPCREQVSKQEAATTASSRAAVSGQPVPGALVFETLNFEHAEQAEEEAAAIQSVATDYSLMLHAVMHIHVYLFFIFCFTAIYHARCDIGYLVYRCMRFSAIRLFRGNPNPYPNFRVPKFRVPAYFGYTSGNGS